MSHGDVIMQLTGHILYQALDPPQLEAVIEHVADCPLCIEELSAMQALLTGEPSTLLAQIASLFSHDTFAENLAAMAELPTAEAKRRYPLAWSHVQHCRQCSATLRLTQDSLSDVQADAGDSPAVSPAFSPSHVTELLPAYVMARLIHGVDADVTFAELVAHLQTCESCQADYEKLQTLIGATPPPSANLLSWISILGKWHTQLRKGVTHLPDRLEGLLLNSQAKFRSLAGQWLAYQLTPASAWRSAPGDAPSQPPLAEVLPIAIPEADLLILLMLQADEQGLGTLTLKFERASAHRPVSQPAYIDLKHSAGQISLSTDDNGIVSIDNLKPGEYTVRLQFDGRQWSLELNLSDIDSPASSEPTPGPPAAR